MYMIQLMTLRSCGHEDESPVVESDDSVEQHGSDGNSSSADEIGTSGQQ